MRKLKLQVQITVNGYVSSKNGEMDWMVWDWDDELKDFVQGITDPVDTILMGRNMVDGFIASWTAIKNDPENPQVEAAKKFIDTPKIVFSKTLEKSQWENTEVINGELTHEVNALKKKEGKDMIVYGGASFVSSLIEHNLIDDYYLFVNPVTLNEGLTIFGQMEQMKMNLVKSKVFSCGIVLLHYQPTTDLGNSSNYE